MSCPFIKCGVHSFCIQQKFIIHLISLNIRFRPKLIWIYVISATRFNETNNLLCNALSNLDKIKTNPELSMFLYSKIRYWSLLYQNNNVLPKYKDEFICASHEKRIIASTNFSSVRSKKFNISNPRYSQVVLIFHNPQKNSC